MLAYTFLKQLKKLPAHRWAVSVNGVKKGPVTKHDLGLKGTAAWLSFDFEAGGPHKIRGEAEPKGAERVILDGTKQEGGDLVFSTRIQGLKFKIVVEFKFKQDGQKMRYRFDGTTN